MSDLELNHDPNAWRDAFEDDAAHNLITTRNGHTPTHYCTDCGTLVEGPALPDLPCPGRPT